MTTSAPAQLEPPPGEDTGGARWRGVIAQGYPRSFAIGSAFSIAWSPCIGPILGAVLALAAVSGTAAQGALLLVSYALGLGVWFLAFGAFFGYLSPRLRRIQPHMGKLMAAGGALFIVLGSMMFLGEFSRLNEYFLSFGFFFDQTASTEEQLTGSLSGAIGPAVAFLGGVLSFLSPCVLPLVPAYLVNIAGEAVLASEHQRAGERGRVFMHAVAFVLGFTVVFALLGASAGALSELINEHLDTLTRVAGVLLMVMGMQMSGLVHIPYLDRTYQVQVR